MIKNYCHFSQFLLSTYATCVTQQMQFNEQGCPQVLGLTLFKQFSSHTIELIQLAQFIHFN